MRLLPCLLLSGCLVTDRMVDALLDADGDGERTVVVGGADCDDHDGGVGPGRAEICHNGKDDDCDGVVDDVGVGAVPLWRDRDLDGYGENGASVWRCVEERGFATRSGDCDDLNNERHPGIDEVCGNAIDDDCDGDPEDELGARWWPDRDHDGQGDDSATAVQACDGPAEHVLNADDCDDWDPRIFRGAEEVYYDGIDQNCDAASGEFDRDGDGWEVDPALATDPLYVPSTPVDCDDDDPTIHPGAPENFYDGVDQDCAGDDDFDLDGDGFRSVNHGGDDCDDRVEERHPGLPDACYDGFDADCDVRFEFDCDRDGHDAAPFGGDDCDDADPNAWAQCAACDDGDGDGRYAGCDAYVTVEPDCDDADNEVWVSCATCGDGDGDGFWSGCDFYDRHTEDCDDDDARVWVRCGSCEDLDADGHASACDVPDGDCDDELANAWTACEGCVDEDGDGYGVGACEPGAPVDCDDTDPDVFERCGACVDLDGDGARTGCDQHLLTPDDCDDADPTVGGHVFEELEDGVDQDCDGTDLTVSERDGLFVAPSGEDVPACGTRARPCATPAYAAVRARWQGGKALWLAAGEYAGFEAWGSVYGGFEEGTWVRGGGRTVLDVGDDDALVVMGSVAVVESLHLSKAKAEQGQVGAVVWSTFGLFRDINVDFRSTGTCGLLYSYGRKLFIQDSAFEGCGGSGQNVGIRIVSEFAAIERSSISLDDAPGTTWIRGIDMRAGAGQVFLSDVTVEVAESGDSTGIAISENYEFSLISSSVTVMSDALAFGIWGAAKRVVLHGSVIDIEGSEVSAVSLQLDSGVHEAVSSAVRATGDLAVAFHVFGDSAEMNVVNVTARAHGNGAKGLDIATGVDVSLVNSVLTSDGVPWTINNASLSLDHVLVDAGCASYDPITGECETREDWIEVCDWRGCGGAVSVIEAPAELDSWRWYETLATSPAVNAGIDPGDLTGWRTSVNGEARPLGGQWDLGAWER